MREVHPAHHQAAKAVVVLVLIGATTGCATIGGAARGWFPDMAPNGMERRELALRHSLAAGSFEAVRREVGGKGKSAPDDRLLRTLYVGLAAYYAGDHLESAAAFDRAGEMADDRYTKSVSRGALSLVTNDLALPYVPPPTERLLAPYYAMLSFVARHDMLSAAVEARRIGALLERYEDENEPVDDSLRLVLRYVSAAVFDAAGQRDDAGVAWRNAAVLAGHRELAVRGDPSATGDVIVIIERGFVSHKIEREVIVELGSADTVGIGDGSGGAGLARLIARIGEEPGGGAWHDPRTRRLRIRADDDESPDHLLKLAWPAFSRAVVARAPIALAAGDSLHSALAVSADVSGALAADFSRRMPAVIARAAARAAIRYAAANEAEKKSKGAKHVATLAGVLLERADTRSWHLLPGEISVIRLSLPPGTHRLQLTGTESGGSAPAMRDLGDLQVTAGRTHFVTARSWNER